MNQPLYKQIAHQILKVQKCSNFCSNSRKNIFFLNLLIQIKFEVSEGREERKKGKKGRKEERKKGRKEERKKGRKEESKKGRKEERKKGRQRKSVYRNLQET